jgi:hypothetical protein
MDNIVTWLSDYNTGLGLVIGFTEHLQNITTNNYDNFTPKITVTTSRTKSSEPSLAVAW